MEGGEGRGGGGGLFVHTPETSSDILLNRRAWPAIVSILRCSLPRTPVKLSHTQTQHSTESCLQSPLRHTHTHTHKSQTRHKSRRFGDEKNATNTRTVYDLTSKSFLMYTLTTTSPLMLLQRYVLMNFPLWMVLFLIRLPLSESGTKTMVNIFLSTRAPRFLPRVCFVFVPLQPVC